MDRVATLDPRARAAPDRAGPITAEWLGRRPYREAWALQRELVAERAEGRIADRLLLLEHEPVLTIGRNGDEHHVRASAEELARFGLELVRVERGGEVTWHGPGQLTAYPIVRLADRGILLRPFVRLLEASLVDTCAALGVVAAPRATLPGCWCDPDGPQPRKIGALGLRLERGVTYHGIALNVTADLGAFGLIDPCGLPGVATTSIARERGRPAEPPSTASVEAAGRVFGEAFARRLGVPLAWAG